MINAAILGCGAMGKTLKNTIKDRTDIVCVGAVEPQKWQTLEDIKESIDVVIDFSHPVNLSMIEDYTEKHPCAVVIATTGHDDREMLRIKELSKNVPLVLSANYSLGVTVMKRVLKEMSEALGDDYDIELIEKHHNMKLDSPSGTAKTLVEAIDEGKRLQRVYGRFGNGKRGKEIGIHAVRGGTITGEHTVIFAGQDEIIEITHTAGSKKIFAVGAIKAALFAVDMPAGLYSMEDVLFAEA